MCGSSSFNNKHYMQALKPFFVVIAKGLLVLGIRPCINTDMYYDLQ